MENSLLLARFIGPFIVLVAIAVLFNRKALLRIAEDFSKNPALIYISGLITFTAGLAIVLFHNIWAADWRLIITLFGWITLIKGAWLVIFPGTIAKVSSRFTKNINMVTVPWLIMFALGIFLVIKGY